MNTLALMQQRSNSDVNLAEFYTPVALQHLEVGKFTFPQMVECNILRMPLQVVNGQPIVPSHLSWLQPFVDFCSSFNDKTFTQLPFWYLTVRFTLSDSRSEDWHVDGFSQRYVHKPERSYLWCSNNPTLIYDKPVMFPSDFDGKMHNVHRFLQKTLEVRSADLLKDYSVMKEGTVYVIDPYVIHRKPKIPESAKHRVFVRLSNTPIVIEDDNYTLNPETPTVVTYGRVGSEIADRFIDYKYRSIK